MRELTFKGFLAQYVRRLSLSDTNGFYKLAKEASSINPRLREPLLLYALYSGKQPILLQATKDHKLHAEYRAMLLQHSADSMTKLFEEESPLLPPEYHKIWKSYQTQKTESKLTTTLRN